MQVISRRRLAEYAAQQLTAQPDSLATIARQLAAYLYAHKQLKQLDMLLRDIQMVLSSKYDVVAVDVTSAFALTQTLRAEITAFVAKQTGKTKVTLSETIDPALIGGVTIRTPETFFDGSVRTQLQQLTTLTKDKE